MSNPNIKNYGIRLTTETAREGQKKGVATKLARKQRRKDLQELLMFYLFKMKPSKEQKQEVKQALPKLLDDEISKFVYMLAKQIKQAEEGDREAFSFLFDIINSM